MVKKLDTNNIDVIKNTNKINSTLNSIEHGSNGTASYADSLKMDLKKKQQKQSIHIKNNSLSTIDNNVNGLLNEFVSNDSNVQKQNLKLNDNQAKVQNQSVNHFSQLNNVNNKTSTTTTITTSSNQIKKRTSLVGETTKSVSTKQLSVTSTSANATPSTTKSQNDSMELDCNKKRMTLNIEKDDTEFIEVDFLIKGIIEDTLEVNFKDKNFNFKFKTTDNSFLRLHHIDGNLLKATYTTHRIVNGTINGESTAEDRFNNLKVQYDQNKLPTFIYEVKNLFDKIKPNECSYELSDNRLKLKLRKKMPIKWGALEVLPKEMGTNFLKNVSPVQKRDDTGFKYKSLKPSSNVNKLINGYEKSISTINKSPPQKEQKDEIPIPPPLPDNKLYSINCKKLNGDLNENKKEIDESSMLNNLLISPLKNDDNNAAFENNKVIPLSFNKSDNEDNNDNELALLLFLKNNRAKNKSDNKSDDEADNPPTQFREQIITQQLTTSFTPSLKLNLKDARGKIGYTGLSNLGNTCYMNATLQCLSNTIELRDYFLNEDYKEDLNRDNFLGSGGQLAEAFSEVLYKLWCGETTYFSPSRFKALIDKKCSQFIGYSQHDSVEFMEHFLDVLHEDLNKVDRNNFQPAKPIENEEELTDDQLANEQWLRHKERNNSIITKLFYGQYKSKLVCPKCAKVSITFDPFLYLPVPLTKNKIVYDFYFIPLDNRQTPKCMSCKLPQGSKVLSIIEFVVSKTGLECQELVACQINQFNELEQEFKLKNYLPDKLSETSKFLFVYQMPKDRSVNKFIIHQSIPDRITETKIPRFSMCGNCEFCNRQLSKSGSSLKHCPKCKKVFYCNDKCMDDDFNLHSPKCSSDPVLIGWPSMFFTSVDNLTYEEIMEKLEKLALNTVDLETKILEKEENFQTEKNLDKNEMIHAAEEIKEGQLVSEINDEVSQNKEENEEMNICENESTDSSPANNESSSSFEKDLQNDSKKEVVETKEELLIRATNNSFKFILRGKDEDLKAKKEVIYIPKDNSNEEQEKFRKSIQTYYYLYIDWKEKYRKPIEESDQYVTYSLNVTAKNLKLISTGDKLEFNKFKQEKSECNLEDLMTKFTELETLSSQEAWVCPTCKEPRTASKELTIWRPPQILIIQLKRFSYSSFSREKIGKFVNYPVKGFEITKFCSDPKLLDQEHKPIYDLYAVIDHFGGLYGGHYTANANTFVEDNELGWRAFNDSSVRDIDEEAAVSHSAYVLFYRLRSD